MLLWENIILAINSLLSNKMRALLTMLGIIIGIGAVIAIITVGDSLTLSISENMQSMGANDVYIMIKQKAEEKEEEGSIDGVKFGTYSTTSKIEEEDCLSDDMLKEMCNRFSDEIYALSLEYEIGNSIAERGKTSANVSLQGVNVGYYVTNKITMLDGHMFSQTDFEEGRSVAIVSDKLVNKLFNGNIQKALGQDIKVSINNQMGNFTIIGVYEHEDNLIMGMGDDVTTNVYLPLKAAMNFEHKDIKYSYVEVITKVGVDSNALANRINNFLEPYYRNNRNCEATAFTMTSMTSMLTDMLSTITVAISVIAGIALIVGGIGVMNIMLVSITERTREIGTRKALGAKNSSIRVQFIVEAIIICLIGGIFGVILGIGGGVLASHILGYPAKPSMSGIIVSLIFSMSIGVFFGYYPANKAAKMNPIDALRYE